MRHMILKLNLVAILLLFGSFAKIDIINKGIIKNSEAVGIKENHNRKLSDDGGGYMILYYNANANYSSGFKICTEKILHISLMEIILHILMKMLHLL